MLPPLEVQIRPKTQASHRTLMSRMTVRKIHPRAGDELKSRASVARGIGRRLNRLRTNSRLWRLSSTRSWRARPASRSRSLTRLRSCQAEAIVVWSEFSHRGSLLLEIRLPSTSERAVGAAWLSAGPAVDAALIVRSAQWRLVG